MRFLNGIFLMLLAFSSIAQDLNYSIKNGKFFTAEAEIPKGCFGQLMTELNGDNTVAAIFLSRASLRGCIDANFSYPGGEEGDISYQIKQSIGDHKYKIKICQLVDGSMGSFCDNVIVRFSNRVYTKPDGSILVLSLEKLGEW